MSESKVRVRFAPSPTGPLHMGGVRTALYNYLFAKKNQGDFILRIEDTDQARYVPGAEQYILDALKWCGIEPVESPENPGEFGPYRQSERKYLYIKYAKQLIDSGHAYYAFDTTEELEAMRERLKEAKSDSLQYNHFTRDEMNNSLSLSSDELHEKLESGIPYVIRVKLPSDEEVKFHDEIRGWVVVKTSNLDDKVLFKSDGMPTYHLANIVDDHLMKITHVIRGEEWLPSAPLHVLLYKFFGWEAPIFAHLPLILRPDGNGKLSKRDGDRLGFPVFPTLWNVPNSDETYSGYREEGYFPEAFINMLAFLGWNPGTEQELFSLDELIEAFTLNRVGKSGSKFDQDKTKWFNQQYLKSKSGIELAKHIKIDGDHSLEKIAKVCDLMKERATFIQDIYSNATYFFNTPTDYDAKTVRKKWKDATGEIILSFQEELKTASDFTENKLEELFKSFLEQKEIGIGAVMPNLRVLLTGKGTGPSLFAIMELLGKEETLSRIETGVIAIKELKTIV